MSNNIVIRQGHLKQRKTSSNRSDTVYSLIDKPYYVDAIRYKVQ